MLPSSVVVLTTFFITTAAKSPCSNLGTLGSFGGQPMGYICALNKEDKQVGGMVILLITYYHCAGAK